MVQTGARVLVVEDEESIGQGLCDVLAFRGHEVCWEKDGSSALSLGLREAFDLILLDIMLPELDGFSVCQELRKGGSSSGIIMLTAKGGEDDVLRGFELGADDYVTKPFSLKQLLARVDAVLGRSRKNEHQTLQVADLLLDFDSSQLTGPSGTVELSGREVGVLRALMEDTSRIVSRRALLRDVWGMKNVDAVETRTVDVHMAKLRKKLFSVSAHTIRTVRGQGYQFARKG